MRQTGRTGIFCIQNYLSYLFAEKCVNVDGKYYKPIFVWLVWFVAKNDVKHVRIQDCVLKGIVPIDYGVAQGTR